MSQASGTPEPRGVSGSPRSGAYAVPTRLNSHLRSRSESVDLLLDGAGGKRSVVSGAEGKKPRSLSPFRDKSGHVRNLSPFLDRDGKVRVSLVREYTVLGGASGDEDDLGGDRDLFGDLYGLRFYTDCARLPRKFFARGCGEKKTYRFAYSMRFGKYVGFGKKNLRRGLAFGGKMQPVTSSPIRGGRRGKNRTGIRPTRAPATIRRGRGSWRG